MVDLNIDGTRLISKHDTYSCCFNFLIWAFSSDNSRAMWLLSGVIFEPEVTPIVEFPTELFLIKSDFSLFEETLEWKRFADTIL